MGATKKNLAIEITYIDLVMYQTQLHTIVMSDNSATLKVLSIESTLKNIIFRTTF